MHESMATLERYFVHECTRERVIYACILRFKIMILLASAGPPTYLMNDTQEHDKVEELNLTSAENELKSVELGHGTSSSDDDFVDLDNIVAKPVRESKPVITVNLHPRITLTTLLISIDT